MRQNVQTLPAAQGKAEIQSIKNYLRSAVHQSDKLQHIRTIVDHILNSEFVLPWNIVQSQWQSGPTHPFFGDSRSPAFAFHPQNDSLVSRAQTESPISSVVQPLQSMKSNPLLAANAANIEFSDEVLQMVLQHFDDSNFKAESYYHGCMKSDPEFSLNYMKALAQHAFKNYQDQTSPEDQQKSLTHIASVVMASVDAAPSHQKNSSLYSFMNEFALLIQTHYSAEPQRFSLKEKIARTFAQTPQVANNSDYKHFILEGLTAPGASFYRKYKAT